MQKYFTPLARANWKYFPNIAQSKILNISLAKTTPKTSGKRSKQENFREIHKLNFIGEYFGAKIFRPTCPGKLEILPKHCPVENFEYQSGENDP